VDGNIWGKELRVTMTIHSCFIYDTWPPEPDRSERAEQACLRIEVESNIIALR
jgi:hypothetical protein